MEGREVFKHAVAMITDVIDDAFKATGTTADDIDWFVPHQANKRIIDGSAHKLGIAPEKVVITVDRHGNTSAASIPLALADAVADRRIKRGHLDPAGGHGRRLHLGLGAAALVRRYRHGCVPPVAMPRNSRHIFRRAPLTSLHLANIVDNSAGYLRRGQGRR